jgi:hypothetical protein
VHLTEHAAKALPMPIGQLTGAQSIRSADSISSSSASGSRTSRSILLTGDDRRGTQTTDFEQLDRLLLDALAASITITAASTAVSTR